MRELQYIKQFDPLYPGIDLWFDKSLNDQNKHWWSTRDTGDVAGLVIIDLSQAKLCHLSVAPKYRLDKRSHAIGLFLYSQAINEFRLNGILDIWAHGCHESIEQFLKVSADRWTPSKSLGDFGRGGEKDIEIRAHLYV